ncbi:MAG: sulfatase-like hydrolase/transferase, partial [Bdellovibrionales bacterium]|nr:sulfatase-like hydrolase/transferase [Bdellovibrionales bacterium]
NIVLVIVEALSAIDSMRTAHSFNLLPQLDELSKDGMLFTNLMANHTHSAGGIVGIFHGSPPFNYPGTIAGPYRSYEGLPSTLGLFKQAGYTTGILFAVPEDQLHLRRWAEHTGFDFLGSPTSIERIKSQPRFVINSVSDKVILEEALLRIDSYLLQKSPFFFSVVTNSTHTPYEHPEGKDNTEEAIWKYTDEQLAIFYHALRQRDFFENGILIITGDHRKRSPVTERERELYQDSALTRSLMIVIGKNVPSNQIDARFIQHSEVIPHLSSLKDPSRPLSEVMYFVDQPGTLPNGSYCQEPGKAFLAKEEARTAHNFCLEGTKIQWLSERPSNGDAIEREIHGRRSYFQSLAHAKNQHVCPIEFDGALDVGEHGVALDIYEGLRLDSDLRGLQPDQSYLVDNLALKKLPNHDAHKDLLYTLDAILEVDTPGTYKFTLGSPGEACLRIGEHYLLYKDWATSDPQLLLERYVIDNTKLEAGRHRLQMRVRLDHSPLDPYLLLFMSEVSAKESRTISKSKLYVPSAAR